MKAAWPRPSLESLSKIVSRHLNGVNSQRAQWGPQAPWWTCKQCRAHSQLAKAGPRQPGRWEKSRASYRPSPLPYTLRRHESSSNDPRNAQNQAPQPTPRKDLPSQAEHRRSLVSKRFTHVMDNVQSNIFLAGQRLNDLTGYSGIEALKKEIEEQGTPSIPSNSPLPLPSTQTPIPAPH